MESSLPGWILVVGFSEASGVEWGGSNSRNGDVICGA